MVLPTTGEGTIISSSPDELRVFPVTNQDINSEIELLTSEDVLRDTVRSFKKNKEGKKDGIGLKKPSTTLADRLVDGIKKGINETLLFLKLKTRVSPFEGHVGQLYKALEVEPIVMSSVIDITLTAEQPRAAEKVLNRLLEVYVQHHNTSRSKDEGIDFFETQATDAKQKLAVYEKQYKEFQKEWGVIDLKSQNLSHINELSELSRALKLLDIAYLETNERISLLKNILNQNKKEIVYTKEMRTIPAIVELERTIVPLLVKRTEIQKKFTPNSREFLDLENQIALLRQEVIREINKALKTDEIEAASLATKRQSMRVEITKLQDTATLLNQQETTLNELLRQIELYQYNYKLYTSKAENARIYSERRKHDLTNVSIISRPVVPEKPSFPKRMRLLIISVFISFFAALGMPFLLEFIDHRVKTPQDVEELLSLPVICSLPEAKQ